eukprot:974559_1
MSIWCIKSLSAMSDVVVQMIMMAVSCNICHLFSIFTIHLLQLICFFGCSVSSPGIEGGFVFGFVLSEPVNKLISLFLLVPSSPINECGSIHKCFIMKMLKVTKSDICFVTAAFSVIEIKQK